MTSANLYFIPGTVVVAVGNDFDSCESFQPGDFPHRQTVTSSAIVTFDPPTRGRYVTVFMTGQYNLGITEAEVYGRPVSGYYIIL